MLDLQPFARQDHQRLQAMAEGGKILGKIRQQLLASAVAGVRFEELENTAQTLIRDVGAKPSFSTVHGYRWATCIMVNDALCHGIPEGQVVNDGDVLTIDVGLIWKGYHVDSTGTKIVGNPSPQLRAFLELGRKALNVAINRVRPGVSIFDISEAMESTVQAGGGSVVAQLTGHGIGTELHMPPNIPCKTYQSDKQVRLSLGQTVAIEIMYNQGGPDLVVDADGWTYRTKDGSISAMFEETVAVGSKGPLVLTQPSINDIL